MLELANQVVQEMRKKTNGWHAEPDPDDAAVAVIRNDLRPKEFGIRLRHCDKDRQIYISTANVQDADGKTIYLTTDRHVKYPDVTVSDKRTPQQIANAIENKIIPTYEAVFALLMVRREQKNDAIARHRKMMGELAEIVDGEVSGSDIEVPRQDNGRNVIGDCCRDTKGFTIHFSALSFDLAKRLLKTWRSFESPV